MYWFWLNIPLAAAFVAAWTGIPLWLVLKHPDAGPQAAAADRSEQSSDNLPQRSDRVLSR